MADNKAVRDGDNVAFQLALDELSDGSFSSKHSVLRGDQTPAPINPSEALADNAAFLDGTTRVTPAGFILDEVAGPALTENDAAAARMDSKRAQVLVIEDATTRGQRAAVSAGGAVSVSVSAAATAIAKAEDAASADADVGVPAMAVRKATPANTSGADGDYEFIQIANGRLWCRTIITDANDVPVLSAANALNSTGAGLVAAQIAAQFDDASPTAITENQFGNLRMSANRNLYGTIRDAAGNERGANVNVSSQLSVSVDADVNSIVDNAAFTDGASRLVPAGFIFDEVAGTALTENDAAAARIDSKRAIVIALEDATTRGQRATIDSAGGVKTKETRSATGTASTVASSATSVTILAANANRLGASVFNDSTQVLYLLLGSATASATVYSVQLLPGAYYEVPANYTGQLTGIWAAANGNARVTELT
jgi:hypothetical protein